MINREKPNPGTNIKGIKMIKQKIILFYTLLLISTGYPQNTGNSRYLLSAAEVLKIMEVSKITYNIIDSSGLSQNAELSVLSDQNYIQKEEDGSTSILQYQLSDEGMSNFTLGENEFKSRSYSAAIHYYTKILTTDKNYYKAYSYIGDSYFANGNYDSAKYYFELAIEKNFIDYTPHWFLADTFNKIGDHDSAIKEMTIAHLLNRNHPDIFRGLKNFRNNWGKKWDDWEINPKCRNYEKDGKIYVESYIDWIGYDMADALWKYEPGFADGIIGKRYNDSLVYYQKEASCVMANINSNNMVEERIILGDNYFQEMIWYEIMIKKVPKLVFLLPRDFFNRIVDYVNKHH
jgi:tetratricopeptide (TPR) repeat protein